MTTEGNVPNPQPKHTGTRTAATGDRHGGKSPISRYSGHRVPGSLAGHATPLAILTSPCYQPLASPICHTAVQQQTSHATATAADD